nr:serine carboxypeptidase-like 13 [Tanacetum cinerariifolium]
VGENEDVQHFYYFVESESNPKDDPLMLWLTGGESCSSLSGLLFEIGPMEFAAVPYNGSFPNLKLRQYSWTQWLDSHPEFVSNPFYIGGDSYSGIPLSIITQLISNGNEDGNEPYINLKSNIERIRVKDIVKEVKDYLKTYSSVVMDISWVDTMPATTDPINTTNTTNMSQSVVDENISQLFDSKGMSHVTNVPAFDKEDFTSWKVSKVTLDQLLSEQVSGNTVKAFGRKGRRKDKISSKEVVFTKADESSSMLAPKITSDLDSECDSQEPLPPLPKLIEVAPSGTSKSLISLSELTLNMADLTLDTLEAKKTRPSVKLSHAYVINKKQRNLLLVLNRALIKRLTHPLSNISYFDGREKSEAANCIMSFIKKMENLNEVRIKELRRDNGTEFKNYKLEEFCDEKGISHNFSSPCTPEQNGVVEKRN